MLTDTILRANLGIEIFTLDTGRLHGDALQLIDVHTRYRYAIRTYRPDP